MPPSDVPRECEALRQLCAGICVDTRSDPGHCNSCNRSCAEGEICEDGSCEVGGDCTQSPCTGFSYCDLTIGRCVRGCVFDDACPSQERCDPEARDCVFLSGTHRCDGICVSDAAVSTCGDRCETCPTVPDSVSLCAAGQCHFECGAGFRRYAGACAELELCDGFCARCPEDSAVLGLQCDGRRSEATECDFTRVRVCAAGCCTWTGDPVSSGGAGLRSGDFFRGDSDADGGVYFLDFNDREASGEDDYSVGYFRPGASQATVIARIGRHPGRSAADIGGADAHLHATWLGLNDAGEQGVYYAHAAVSGSNFESRLPMSIETPFGTDIGRPSIAALPGAAEAVLCLDEAGRLERDAGGEWHELALPRPAISGGATLRILDLDGDSAGNVHALIERKREGSRPRPRTRPKRSSSAR